MKLYGSLTSPFVRKVRITLIEKGVAHEFVNVAASDPAVTTQNPLKAVPLLVRDDGEVFFDSPMLCEMIDAESGRPSLLPPAGEARWAALRWHALGHGMMEAVIARLLEGRRSEACRDPAVTALHESRVQDALAFAEARIGKGALAGNAFGLADIALGVALEYIDLRYPHDWRARFPRAATWHATVRERPSFVDTRPVT
jgi:glutathione S-transferase